MRLGLRTYNLQELWGEVGAFSEVHNLCVDGVLGVPQLSAVTVNISPLVEFAGRCEQEVIYIASSGAAAHTDMPKV